jgi:hypothetical protein
MAKSLTVKATTVMPKLFEYRQNNSGGSFDIEPSSGIATRVWIEALDADDADRRAERVGIYFDGCNDGRDCSCCGDRWDRSYGEGVSSIEIDGYTFDWHDTIYVHRFDGTIEAFTKADAEAIRAALGTGGAS